MKKITRQCCDAVEAFSDGEGHIRQAITYLARGMRRMKKMNDDNACERMIKRLEKMDAKLKEMIIEISFRMD